MKRALPSILYAFMLAASPLGAQEPLAAPETVVSVSGADFGATGIDALGTGWSMSQRHRNVSVAAHLGNGGGSGRGVAYLMRSIGPGTTCASEVAKVTFDLPLGYDGMFLLFSGLDLGPGDYWLVFAKPHRGPFSYANWFASNPLTLETGNSVRYLGMTHIAAEEDISDYVPASLFTVINNGFGYQFRVTGEPVLSGPRRPSR